MRATATTTAADFRLQQSADQPLQSTLTTLFDAISHHDRPHGGQHTMLTNSVRLRHDGPPRYRRPAKRSIVDEGRRPRASDLRSLMRVG
jgi:hypothetical protein